MPSKKGKEICIRSSAAEYLTFVAASGEGGVEAVYADENVWLTQRMMGVLYDVGTNTVNYHLKKVFEDKEVLPESTIRKFRIVQKEGTREVTRDVDHYNLQAIVAVGFKVNNARAVQFRKWANQIVKDYTIQGWAMDVDRLKKGHMFTDEYFERQLAYIREIRLSERKFYNVYHFWYIFLLYYYCIMRNMCAHSAMSVFVMITRLTFQVSTDRISMRYCVCI